VCTGTQCSTCYKSGRLSQSAAALELILTWRRCLAVAPHAVSVISSPPAGLLRHGPLPPSRSTSAAGPCTLPPAVICRSWLHLIPVLDHLCTAAVWVRVVEGSGVGDRSRVDSCRRGVEVWHPWMPPGHRLVGAVDIYRVDQEAAAAAAAAAIEQMTASSASWDGSLLLLSRHRLVLGLLTFDRIRFDIVTATVHRPFTLSFKA